MTTHAGKRARPSSTTASASTPDGPRRQGRARSPSWTRRTAWVGRSDWWRQTLVVSLFKDDVVTSSVTLDRDVALPVQAGDVFGTIEFTLDGKSLGSVDLIAAQSVEEVTIEMLLDYWRDRWLPNLALRDLLRATSSP